MSEPIYLDYNATTPVAAEVVEAMIAALREAWGNPSSAHAYGRAARRAVDGARETAADLVGCSPEELIFTGGGTESDNAAILGVAEALSGRGRHLVISSVEHAAVEEPCRYLESRGFAVTRIGIDRDGLLDADAAIAALRADTVLVSIIHAHNETGVIQPVRRVADAARARGIVIHSDTAQSVGKLPLSVEELGVDLLTVAGHKLYGPKGVGALYLRRGTPFAGFLRGAPHEQGRRAGTENVPAIVGLGAACGLAARELPGRTAHLAELRDRLEAGLRRHVPGLVVHGAAAARLPNTLYVAFPGVDARLLLAATPGVATAAGAACHSGAAYVPQVLRAMGVGEGLALSTLRLTVGCPTTVDEVDRAAELLGRGAAEAVAQPASEESERA